MHCSSCDGVLMPLSSPSVQSSLSFLASVCILAIFHPQNWAAKPFLHYESGSWMRMSRMMIWICPSSNYRKSKHKSACTTPCLYWVLLVAGGARRPSTSSFDGFKVLCSFALVTRPPSIWKSELHMQRLAFVFLFLPHFGACFPAPLLAIHVCVRQHKCFGLLLFWGLHIAPSCLCISFWTTCPAHVQVCRPAWQILSIFRSVNPEILPRLLSM